MSTFSTSREIPATVEDVFAAFRQPERMARWWGPAGFTNTFNVFEFKNGGRWSYVMHGPEAGHYQNESVFAEIEPPKRIVIQHVSKPEYRLTITMTSSAVGTVVSWAQTFEDPEVARRVERIVVPANEENLDRLSAEVLREPGGGDGPGAGSRRPSSAKPSTSPPTTSMRSSARSAPAAW